MSRMLEFARPDPATTTVAKVLADGSIQFRGRVYATILEAPPEWRSLRVDTASYVRWRRAVRALRCARGPAEDEVADG